MLLLYQNLRQAPQQLELALAGPDQEPGMLYSLKGGKNLILKQSPRVQSTWISTKLLSHYSFNVFLCMFSFTQPLQPLTVLATHVAATLKGGGSIIFVSADLDFSTMAVSA